MSDTYAIYRDLGLSSVQAAYGPVALVYYLTTSISSAVTFPLPAPLMCFLLLLRAAVHLPGSPAAPYFFSFERLPGCTVLGGEHVLAALTVLMVAALLISERLAMRAWWLSGAEEDLEEAETRKER
jgi:hypothetical protein